VAGNQQLAIYDIIVASDTIVSLDGEPLGKTARCRRSPIDVEATARSHAIKV